MIDPELLKLLCCPETHQGLTPAQPELLQRLNRQIASGTLQNRSARAVSQELAEALLREDGKVVYPIRDGIPVMLLEEGILLG
jgi:uncharacterized protein YbaR (Trm112 family)